MRPTEIDEAGVKQSRQEGMKDRLPCAPQYSPSQYAGMEVREMPWYDVTAAEQEVVTMLNSTAAAVEQLMSLNDDGSNLDLRLKVRVQVRRSESDLVVTRQQQRRWREMG